MNQLRLLFLFIVLAISFAPIIAAQEGPVWFWFATCGGPVMTLEVQLDSAAIYKTTFPLCREDRNSIESQGQRTGKVRFSFRPERAITWSGYRDTDVTTRANQLIESDLWQAGADPDDLLIGISFSDEFQIYMNTIHIAYPPRRDQTTVTPGLVVITYPAESARNKERPQGQ